MEPAVQRHPHDGLADKIVSGGLIRSSDEVPMLLSGACAGADETFGEMALKHQHQLVHFLGPGDEEWASEKAKQTQSHGFVHVKKELLEGTVVSEALKKAAASRVLGSQRTPDWKARVAEMAARRNFLQVRYADMVYVVGWRLEKGKDQFTGKSDCDPRETPKMDVGGGTGWACQWYIDRFEDGLEDPENCKLFFFDDAGPPWARKAPATQGRWNRWNVRAKEWEPLDKNPPKPSGLYAGIGATKLSSRAESAIRGLYPEISAPSADVAKDGAGLRAAAGAAASYGAVEPAPGMQVMGSGTASSADREVSVVSKVFPNILSSALCSITAPCSVLNGIKQLNPNEHAAILYWGEYKGTMTDPGLYYLNPCGLQMWKISTKTQTLQLKDIKVLDARGNPVVISGVVTFAGTSAKKATIDVDHPWPGSGGGGKESFLELQAAAVLKRVASRFPYEAPEGKPSLQSEGGNISSELRQLLQEKVAITGACIHSFDLVDLSYAPEIAQVMLVRQQAEALVDARRVIVSAAVDMTKDAVGSLRSSGEPMDEQTCKQVTTNLLTVICSGAAATPTVTMNS
mmetsp:Transcript_75178/g.190117  ORF Transcript_75178/g.190117 Transcript_75178/m.190117 type:complete len:572 (-) Transcript_75178:42-1757(-)